MGWFNTTTTTLAYGTGAPSVDDTDTWTIVAWVLGAVLLFLILAATAYVYYNRYGMPSWQLCCGGSSKQRGIVMGYLPAHITVNEGAVEQGVPDIFLRDSMSGRISMEPASIEITEDTTSGVETSGTWAEYLRTTLSMRRTASYRATLEQQARASESASPATIPEDDGTGHDQDGQAVDDAVKDLDGGSSERTESR